MLTKRDGQPKKAHLSGHLIIILNLNISCTTHISKKSTWNYPVYP